MATMSTVLLIGASRGLGLEMARQYRHAGWRVIATARDDAGLERLRALDCEALRVDVAQPASNSGLAWQLDGENLDLAVYVAGVIDRASTTTPPTRETFDHLMHTNVMGAAMALPQITPMLQEAQGVFAVISSVMGSLAQTQSGSSALYRVSKAALNMWMRCAQADHPSLCCLALHPGWVQTDMGGAQATLTPEQSASDIRRTLERVRAARDEFRGTFLNHDGSPIPW
jgi:NAD(P)-dependent dehydrogenase (short-subunit alcohol dehydrogenase family)